MPHYVRFAVAGLALVSLTACENLGWGGSRGGGPTPSSTTNTLGPGGAGYSGTNSQMGTGGSGGGTSDRDTGRSSDFVTGRSRSGPIGTGGAGVSDSPIPQYRP
ncbi:hypothetical protein [Skermanella pratensis]|uniref:hypothetical protein n=1 Tax=Skermanella pratensis TaxID=2233999 RepID=UPI001300EF61|nr:hypothetical protein [Skermanella pratensis]